MHSASLHLTATTLVRCMVFILLLFTLAAPPGAAASTAPRILVLNSYHEGYDWSDDEMNGLRSTLAKSFHRIELFSEYLDTKNLPPTAIFPA